MQRQHVAQVFFVRVGPHVCVGRGPYQLDRNRDPLPTPPHRTLYDGVRLERPADVGQRLLRAFVLHARRAGNHPKRQHLREFGDQGVGHTVGEELFTGVPRQV